jgi:hypothetical protein
MSGRQFVSIVFQDGNTTTKSNIVLCLVIGSAFSQNFEARGRSSGRGGASYVLGSELLFLLTRLGRSSTFSCDETAADESCVFSHSLLFITVMLQLNKKPPSELFDLNSIERQATNDKTRTP